MEKTFGSELRRMRGEARLTLVHIADHMGWSIVYVSDIERNRRNPPAPRDIEKILRRLGKESSLPEMMRLAAEARKSIEIRLSGENSLEVKNMLIALARQVDEGSLDQEIARQIQEILDRGKKP